MNQLLEELFDISFSSVKWVANNVEYLPNILKKDKAVHLTQESFDRLGDFGLSKGNYITIRDILIPILVELAYSELKNDKTSEPDIGIA